MGPGRLTGMNVDSKGRLYYSMLVASMGPGRLTGMNADPPGPRRGRACRFNGARSIDRDERPMTTLSSGPRSLQWGPVD